MTVQLVTEKGKEKCDPAFTKEVMERSHSHLERCYQCIACSSGCPGAYQMDYPPHQLLRMVQLGLKDRVLDSNTFWICLSCETCATRCPNDIEIVLVMDALREIALKEGRKGTTKLPLFHATFLYMVKMFGKVYELGLILVYTIFSGNILKLKGLMRDAVLGVKMFMRGKLAILPPRVKGKAQIKRIFQLSSKTG
ncbi:MAG: 4Fe-4S dicluster domain-containing protein [Dehalococcoidales bacterium]|nr:4Fe-4S dicluster domain-containing protein [Dehalococcoidales bacterium]